MPSSFTPLLKLELPATGELSGTWGTTVNNAITTPLSEAVAGTTTITVGGSDYTLSNGDGSAANEARKMFIVATGTPGASRNVICPAASKFYVFRNDTNQTLTLKTLSGTGIAVPAGQYRFLYCDGTNVVETFNAMASLTLGTALAAASGGTGQSSYTAGDLLYATGTTALSKLGIGASTTILTSSGTAPQWTAASSVAIGTATNLAGGAAGSVPYQSGAATTTFLGIGAANTVMTSSGTAPQWSTALTGLTGVSTTTATLSGNLTLSGGTANGVLYLDGSKVATSGSALTFDGTNFATTGNITLENARYFQSKTTGGSTVRMLGITSGNTAYVGPIDSGPGDMLLNASSSSANIQFYATGSEQMRLTSTGLGIGTTSPATNLEVSGSAARARVSGTAGSVPQLQLSSSGVVNWSLRSNNDGGSDFTIYQDATQRLKIDSSGNLGIGTSSPSSKLDVTGTFGTATTAFSVNNTSAASASNIVRIDFRTGNTFSGNERIAAIWGMNPNAAANNGGALVFGVSANGTATTPSEVARFDQAGNLGIGTSSPGAKLDVRGAGLFLLSGAGSTTPLILRNDTGGATTQIVKLGFDSSGAIKSSINAAVWNNDYMTFNVGSDTERMRIDAFGNLGLGVTPSAWSSSVASQVGYGAALSSRAAGSTASDMTHGAYWNGTNWLYQYSSVGAARYQMTGANAGSTHAWFVSAGGTAGNAISFTQAMTLSATGGLSLGDTNDPGTGVGSFNGVRIGGNGSDINSTYNGASSVLTFRINGTERARIDASGNLGLGVTPSAWWSGSKVIQIGLGATFEGRTGTNIATVSSNSFINSSGVESYINTAAATKYNQGVSGDHRWYTAPSGTAGNAISFTQAMTLDASGNLGLGVTPSAWNLGKAIEVNNVGNALWGAAASEIDVSQNAYYNSGWKYAASSFATRYEQNTGVHRWYTAPSGTAGNAISFTQAMTLDASGNLGVGTTSPGGSATARQLTVFGTTAQVSASVSAFAANFGNNGTVGYVEATGANPFAFYTNGSERARITSGGAFLVGTTSTNGAFSLNTNTETWAAWLQQAHTTTGRSLVRLQYNVATPNVATDYFLYCDDATAVRANIRSNGGLANYQSNNVDLSDARTKKDITPAPSYWNKIGALEIVTYKYKDQTHDDINVGVIAQQVEQVEPVWVDTEGFGEVPEGEEPMKTVYTKDITFAAIKALQEAMFRIEALEAKVAALETH